MFIFSPFSLYVVHYLSFSKFDSVFIQPLCVSTNLDMYKIELFSSTTWNYYILIF